MAERHSLSSLNLKEKMEDTVKLIIEAYTKVADGLKRIDLETKKVSVKAYWAGTIIRIDIKETE